MRLYFSEIPCLGSLKSMYLAKLALLAEYQVYICETRKELSSGWTFNESQGGIDVCWEEPETFVQRLSDAHSAVLALAHFPLLDDYDPETCAWVIRNKEPINCYTANPLTLTSIDRLRFHQPIPLHYR